MLRRWGQGRASDGTSAREWMHRGADLLDHDDPGTWSEAEGCYRRAIEADDRLRGAWFDLALVHKWRQEWTETLACNRRALGISTEGAGDPAYWNAGIAATALGDWPTARWAWTGYGITLPDGYPRTEGQFGSGVVRLPDGEVVWGGRVDPARMRIDNVPLPDSGFRCGDIVLHDGAPNGSRVSSGREYPVFDVLRRLEASPVPTVQVDVTADDDAVAQLAQRLAAGGLVAENWSHSITVFCRACSEGRVDYDQPGHDHAPKEPDGTARFGCSGDLGRVSEVAAAWSADTGGLVDHVEIVA